MSDRGRGQLGWLNNSSSNVRERRHRRAAPIIQFSGWPGPRNALAAAARARAGHARTESRSMLFA
eukprot:2293407-Pyramimonas_sp.AAC.1